MVCNNSNISLVHDIITTSNGIVYQWNKQPNMEILIQNKPTTVPAKSYKKTVNPLHRTTTSYDTIVQQTEPLQVTTQ